MKKKLFFILIFLTAYAVKSHAQMTIRNFGDAKMHPDTQLGFFGNVINDGVFENAYGLAGFYGNQGFSFSGSVTPIFNDIEIANIGGVILNTPMTISNNANFIYGDFITVKNNSFNFLELAPSAFYVGDSNFSKVDGFVQTSNTENFLFPVGDSVFLRPLAIRSFTENTIFRCAYNFEDPTYRYPYRTEPNSPITSISSIEYWNLQGSSNTSITISWNGRSAISNLTDNEKQLTIVGFDKSRAVWINIGVTDITGDIEEGFITSNTFLPDTYSAISFGVVEKSTTIIPKAHDYLVSPNGDGINDFLFFPELEDFENNRVQIFDRNGIKVFDKYNYTNEFTGLSESGTLSISRDSGLSQGVYFYLISLTDEKTTLQGFLYLDR